MLKLIADEFPDALQNATFAITVADALHPVALPRTVDRDTENWRSVTGGDRRITRVASPVRVRCSISTRRMPMPGRSIIFCRMRT